MKSNLADYLDNYKSNSDSHVNKSSSMSNSVIKSKDMENSVAPKVYFSKIFPDKSGLSCDYFKCIVTFFYVNHT